MNKEFTFTYNKECDEWHMKIKGFGFYINRKALEALYHEIGSQLEDTQRQYHDTERFCK